MWKRRWRRWIWRTEKSMQYSSPTSRSMRSFYMVCREGRELLCTAQYTVQVLMVTSCEGRECTFQCNLCVLTALRMVFQGHKMVQSGWAMFEEGCSEAGPGGVFFFFFFFLIFVGHIVLFVGPLIPLFRTSGDVCPGFQSQGGLACMLSCLRAIPQIHLWCNTCRPLDGQHGSRATLTYILAAVRHYPQALVASRSEPRLKPMAWARARTRNPTVPQHSALNHSTIPARRTGGVTTAPKITEDGNDTTSNTSQDDDGRG